MTTSGAVVSMPKPSPFGFGAFDPSKMMGGVGFSPDDVLCEVPSMVTVLVTSGRISVKTRVKGRMVQCCMDALIESETGERVCWCRRGTVERFRWQVYIGKRARVGPDRLPPV